MLALQSAAGALVLLTLAWVISENRRAVSWANVGRGLIVTLLLAVLLLKIPQLKAAFALVNNATDRSQPRPGPEPHSCSGISAAVRSVRADGSRERVHPRFSGPAARAGDERAHHAPVLLAHPAAASFAASRAARAHARHRRSRRYRDGSQHLRRHGRGAALHPALSARLSRSELFIVMTGGMAGIAGTVFVHLRDPAPARDPGRCRTSPRGLRARRAGSDPDQPDHGPGARGSRDQPASSKTPSPSQPTPWTPL